VLERISHVCSFVSVLFVFRRSPSLKRKPRRMPSRSTRTAGPCRMAWRSCSAARARTTERACQLNLRASSTYSVENTSTHLASLDASRGSRAGSTANCFCTRLGSASAEKISRSTAPSSRLELLTCNQFCTCVDFEHVSGYVTASCILGYAWIIHISSTAGVRLRVCPVGVRARPNTVSEMAMRAQGRVCGAPHTRVDVRSGECSVCSMDVAWSFPRPPLRADCRPANSAQQQRCHSPSRERAAADGGGECATRL
jgi:hypothetical protein